MNSSPLLHGFHYSHLSHFDKFAYEQIFDSWCEGGTVAVVELPGINYRISSALKLGSLVSFVIEDNPLLFHIDTSHIYYQRVGKTICICTKRIYPVDEYKYIRSKLIDRCNHIIDLSNNLDTKFEKLLFIHDYLSDNLTYNRLYTSSKHYKESHTVVGALLNSSCVCDGYALAFKLLCDQLDIQCIVVEGEIDCFDECGPHAWNCAILDDYVYHIDVTLDSCLGSIGVNDSRRFFLRSDQFFLETHKWDLSLYPHSNHDYPA